MSEVKTTLQGHSTGAIMSIQRSNWNSTSSKPVQPTVPQQPATPEVPEQSTNGCLGDVEINQPAAPEQSTDGCLGDVEINQ